MTRAKSAFVTTASNFQPSCGLIPFCINTSNICWAVGAAGRNRTKPKAWTVIATDDKKTARINLLRYVLRTLDHTDAKIEKPDPDVVLTAAKAKGRLAR